MAETVKLWKSDARGRFIELALGQKKDVSVDLTDYWPNTEALSSGNAVWTVPAGLTLNGNAVAGLIAKAYVKGDTAGEYDCKLVATSDSGNYIEPFSFRVVVK